MTSTYAKRPVQSPRLAQVAQSRQSIAIAPAVADAEVIGRRKGTTLTPIGATIPEIRRSRAAQSSGSGGKSSIKQAPSKTNAGEASGNIVPPQSSNVLEGHTDTYRETSSTVQPDAADCAERIAPGASVGNNSSDGRWSYRAAGAALIAAVFITWGFGVYFITWALSVAWVAP
jgi:hypothetical protein